MLVLELVLKLLVLELLYLSLDFREGSGAAELTRHEMRGNGRMAGPSRHDGHGAVHGCVGNRRHGMRAVHWGVHLFVLAGELVLVLHLMCLVWLLVGHVVVGSAVKIWEFESQAFAEVGHTVDVYELEVIVAVHHVLVLPTSPIIVIHHGHVGVCKSTNGRFLVWGRVEGGPPLKGCAKVLASSKYPNLLPALAAAG